MAPIMWSTTPGRTRSGRTYDVILDNVGNRPFADVRRALAPKGRLIPNSGHAGMGYVLRALARSAFVRQQGRPCVSTPNDKDLVVLTELAGSGKLTPVVDRAYPLSETSEALRYLGERHARGKVVIVL